MLKGFKQYITEGGNVKIEGVSADPIAITKETRKPVATDVAGFLHGLSNTHKLQHGSHLFGDNASAVSNGSAFSGSTHHLFDKDISDEDFAHYKPVVGDLDVKVPREHLTALAGHLQPGKSYGKYTVVGHKKSADGYNALIKHDNGQVHQIDFEGSDYDKKGPSEFDKFAHSSNWRDVQSGIKGAHHKILLNAVGTNKNKFSILHGLGSREGDDPKWSKDTDNISSTLFGKEAPKENLGSFHGVVQNIKNHIDPKKHQEIYDKYKNDVSRMKNLNSEASLSHMRQHLNVKDNSVNESEEETHHTSVVPITGFVPISHMGHSKDLGGTLSQLPGTKHVGISSKSEAYSPEERKNILERQWGGGVNAHVVSGAGETIRAAHDSLPKTGKKVLHLLVGNDRKSLATGLKKSLEAGKIKEMEGRSFDEIHIHHPEDTDRSHGMSGTKMREAANAGDIETFHKHLGSNFSKEEAEQHMKRFQKGIQDGSIPLKRK
jgi:hypothetical protein